MSEDHEKIYERLREVEQEGVRMDERQKAFAQSHKEIKAGLWAVESRLEKLYIKIGITFGICTVILSVVFKFVK